MTNRFLAAITAAVLTSIAATPVLAQQPPAAPVAPKAAPKAKAPAPAKQPPAQAAPAAPGQRALPQAPAQNAQQAPAPTGNQLGDQQVQLVYSPWTKICPKDEPPAGQPAPATPPPQFCVTGKDGRLESGQPVISAVIIAPQDQSQKLLRVTLPLGMQLTQGTRIYVDKNPPIQRPFVLCFPQGCLADYEATPELIDSMKKGQTLFVQAINSSGDLLTLTLPVADEFAKSFDGPAIDPKVLEEQQKKMQDEMQKKAAAVKQQLEQSGGAAPAAQ